MCELWWQLCLSSGCMGDNTIDVLPFAVVRLTRHVSHAHHKLSTASHGGTDVRSRYTACFMPTIGTHVDQDVPIIGKLTSTLRIHTRGSRPLSDHSFLRSVTAPTQCRLAFTIQRAAETKEKNVTTYFNVQSACKRLKYEVTAMVSR